MTPTYITSVYMPRHFPTAQELAHACLCEAGWQELTPWLCGPGPKAMRERPHIVSYHYGWNGKEAAEAGYDLSLMGAGALAQARYIVHLSVCPRHKKCPHLTHEYKRPNGTLIEGAEAEYCRQENHKRYHNPPIFEEVLEHFWWYQDLLLQKGQT